MLSLIQQNSKRYKETVWIEVDESLLVDTRREFVFVSDTGRQGGISGTGVPKT